MKAEQIIIEKIYDAKEGKNQDFKTLQLRTTEKVTNFLNTLLNSDGFDKTKVCFQSVHKDVITKLGIAEGGNLGNILGKELRIVHTESLTPAVGFQPMVNPAKDNAPVTSGGRQIYFKRELGAAGTPDVTVKRDTVEAEVSIFSSSVEDSAM